MLGVQYKPSFIKTVKHFDGDLFDEVIEKIELLKNEENHSMLKVHKLHGPLTGCYSFSVNYQTRIVFKYISNKEVVLLNIGDHDIYK